MQKDFSYPLMIDDLSSGESKYVVKAETEELGILKDILKVEAVHELEVNFKLKFDKKNFLLVVNGIIRAIVELKSVVSLENFNKKYKEQFSLKFNTKPSKAHKEEEELDFDDEIIDDVENGQIDLGQIAIEQLAVLIDDYPKKPGEVFSFKCEFSEEDKKNPFDILAKLKK